MNKQAKLFLNTVLWGVVLWFFGYVLGFVFFMFVPYALIGWYIMPFGVAATLWVLLKKIKRNKFQCYVGMSVIWTLIAVVFDYLFIVKLLKPTTGYYKIDVYFYYLLTFVLPVLVGWRKKETGLIQ